jgi:hypothetical protein
MVEGYYEVILDHMSHNMYTSWVSLRKESQVITYVPTRQ